MGAYTFRTIGTGHDAARAFAAAVEDARYEHGHAGYSGTIAEKSGFIIIQQTPLTLDAAMALADALIDKGDPRVDDKWGPAGALRVIDPGRIDYRQQPAPVDGWLFFGWASS